MTNRLYVIVQEGLVSLEGTGDFVGMDVEVIDMDTEGADKDELAKIRLDDSTFYRAFHKFETVSATDISKVVEAK